MSPSPPTRFAGESWRTALSMHARVVGAVIMRDLQTRFGTGYFGFLLGLMIPLAHLTIAMLITLLVKRPAPIGTDLLTFLMTGVLPFIIWLYAHRQVMMTLVQNRPLLHFPGVDIFDLFVARFIAEIASGTLVAIVVLGTLPLLGHHLDVSDWPNFLSSLVFAWLLGISTGLVFGGLTLFVPVASIFGSLMGPLFWAISGIFFLPDDLPDALRTGLAYNPLCHVIDKTRIAYYSEYSSGFFDQLLLTTIIGLCLLIGLILVKGARKIT